MLYRKTIIWPRDMFRFTADDVPAQPARSGWRIHLLLFLLTILTTTAVGAMMKGNDPFSSFQAFASGFPFSATIIAILGIHESAHYFAGKRWGIEVTLPYFIPAPFPPIGTFGAVIRMRSPIPNRKALVDVGAAGPIAGFIVAVAASAVGLHYSQVVEVVPGSSSIILGESLMFKAISFLVIGPLAPGQDVMLHPVAFAGWIGLFVTALNLMPFGQLDGGHVLFALSPRFHDLFRVVRIPLLLLLGVTFWSGWYVWAFLLMYIGGGHPHPEQVERRLDPLRTAVAIISLVIFVLCSMPAPVGS